MLQDEHPSLGNAQKLQEILAKKGGSSKAQLGKVTSFDSTVIWNEPEWDFSVVGKFENGVITPYAVDKTKHYDNCQKSLSTVPPHIGSLWEVPPACDDLASETKHAHSRLGSPCFSPNLIADRHRFHISIIARLHHNTGAPGASLLPFLIVYPTVMDLLSR